MRFMLTVQQCTAPMQQFVSQLSRFLITRCMGNIEMILNKITLRETGLSRIIAIKSGKLIYCVYYSNSFPGAKLKKLVQFLYVTRQRSVNIFKRWAFLRFQKLFDAPRRSGQTRGHHGYDFALMSIVLFRVLVFRSLFYP